MAKDCHAGAKGKTPKSNTMEYYMKVQGGGSSVDPKVNHESSSAEQPKGPSGRKSKDKANAKNYVENPKTPAGKVSKMVSKKAK
jgi:hypothetical protein